MHFTIGMTFNPHAALKWILGAYNKLKYIVILDATTKYRDMYFVEWAEKPAAHDMIRNYMIRNLSAEYLISTVEWVLVSRSRTRTDSSPPPPPPLPAEFP